MGFFNGVGRFIIVLLNIIFVIVSIVMLASGLVLKFYPDNAYLKSTEDQLKTSLQQLLNGTGQAGSVNMDDFSLVGMFETAAVCLIVVGAFLLVVAFCGCCGACCKIQTLLIVYASILIVLLVGQLSLIIALYASSAVKNIVKKELRVSLSNYKGLTGANVESLLWNAAMQEFQCCGVIDYKDFETYAPHWNNTPEVGGSLATPLDTPIACCKTVPSDAAEAQNCATNLDSTTNNYDKGCFDSIWNKLFDNPLMLGIVLTVAFVIQILLIVFTVLVYKERKKEKVEDINS